MQIYEEYWKITLEYSDYCGGSFNECLKTIVDFIDNNDTRIYSKELYAQLQQQVFKLNPKEDLASVRKAINQFLKLGFINNFLQDYHTKTKDFLNSNDKETKQRLFSEIMYDNASFNRSVTTPSNTKEINFLIKTLESCKAISQNNLLALMTCDTTKKDFITKDELDILTKKVIDKNLNKRKYNQRNYLWNLCKNVLIGIYLDSNNNLTLEEAEITEQIQTSGTRDTYKQTLYKYALYNECKNIEGQICCFVEKMKYPSLIASHIKPYAKCDINEQFDSNNGLLLSKNIDHLFDSGWISFDDNGKIIFADFLDEKLKVFLCNKKLDDKYLNQERLKYLKFHREFVFDNSKTYKF